MQESFIATHATTEAFQGLEALRANGGIGLLVGASGTGKTAALRAYQRQHGASIVLYRATVVNTPRSLVRDLLASFGILWHGSTRGGFFVLRHLIRNEKIELLLVDDVQRLARHTLDLLRAMHEATGVAVALVGTPDMGRRLPGKSPELTAHVRRVHTFGALTLSDALAIVNQAGIGRKRRAYWSRVAVARALLGASEGNFRRVLQLIDAARARARDEHRSVTTRTIARAANDFPRLSVQGM